MNPEKRKYTGAPSMRTPDKIVLIASLFAVSTGLGACKPVSPEGVRVEQSGTICDSYNTDMSARLLGPIVDEEGIVKRVVRVQVIANKVCRNAVTEDTIRKGLVLPENDEFAGYHNPQVVLSVNEASNPKPCFFPPNERGDGPQGVAGLLIPSPGESAPSMVIYDGEGRNDIQRALKDSEARISVCMVWQKPKGEDGEPGAFDMIPYTSVYDYQAGDQPLP
jgi:hypothetical protein